MPLNPADSISGLDKTDPTSDDPVNEGDNQIRDLKDTLIKQFIGFTTGTSVQNQVPITVSAEEINTASTTAFLKVADNLSELTDPAKAAASRDNLHLGELAILDEVASAQIKNGTIVNADVSSTADIDYSKMESSANAPTWNQDTTGNAATATDGITSNDRLDALAPTTSYQLGTVITDATGGGQLVFQTDPQLYGTNIRLGTPAYLVGTNITGTAAGLSIGGNAATATDGITSNDKLNALAPTDSFQLREVIIDETGGGLLVFNDSPELFNPDLGRPSACDGTNITGTGAGFTAGNVLSVTSDDITVNFAGTDQGTVHEFKQIKIAGMVFITGKITITDTTSVGFFISSSPLASGAPISVQISNSGLAGDMGPIRILMENNTNFFISGLPVDEGDDLGLVSVTIIGVAA